jgi:hypothetical protein
MSGRSRDQPLNGRPGMGVASLLDAQQRGEGRPVAVPGESRGPRRARGRPGGAAAPGACENRDPSRRREQRKNIWNPTLQAPVRPALNPLIYSAFWLMRGVTPVRPAGARHPTAAAPGETRKAGNRMTGTAPATFLRLGPRSHVLERRFSSRGGRRSAAGQRNMSWPDCPRNPCPPRGQGCLLIPRLQKRGRIYLTDDFPPRPRRRRAG